MDRFRYQLACKIFAVIEMLMISAMLVVMTTSEVLQILKDWRKPEEDLAFAQIFLYFIILLGHFIEIVVLITGVRVLQACRISPTSMDTFMMKKGKSSCEVWCMLEFLRLMVMLLCLSVRLLLFSLVKYDEFTDSEIFKQAAVALPVITNLISWGITHKYITELDSLLQRKLGAINSEHGFEEIYPIVQ